MVEYQYATPPLERLGAAVAEAVAAGVSAEEMITIIATTLGQQNGHIGKARELQDATAMFDVPAVPDAPPLFTELPEGLIAVPEAAKKHDIPRKTILTWIRLGKINAKGKVTQGKGGPRLLVSESDLLDYKDAPRSKGGRPGKRLPSFSNCAGEMVFDELPEGMIDLPSAAKTYGIPRRTIQTWLRKGKLSRQGRLRGPARGGGYILISEDQLIAYMNEPRHQGGRPRKKLPSFSDCAEEVVFDGLPPGLIDLPSAARKYSLNKWTLRNWVTKGYLKRYGRLKGSAQGGGFILVGESELRLYMDMPKSKGGRPSGKGYDVEAVPPVREEELVYDVLPLGLIDVPTAASTYKINLMTITGWIRKGHIRLRGRLKAPARGGGYLVVSEEELLQYKANPRKTGRPKQKVH